YATSSPSLSLKKPASKPISHSVASSGFRSTLPAPPIVTAGTDSPWIVATVELKNCCAVRKPGIRPARPHAPRRRSEERASDCGKKSSSLITHEPLSEGYHWNPNC